VNIIPLPESHESRNQFSRRDFPQAIAWLLWMSSAKRHSKVFLLAFIRLGNDCPIEAPIWRSPCKSKLVGLLLLSCLVIDDGSLYRDMLQGYSGSKASPTPNKLTTELMAVGTVWAIRDFNRRTQPIGTGCLNVISSRERKRRTPRVNIDAFEYPNS
jgi:hypothetical protein